MTEEQLEEMGPIDYVVLERRGEQPTVSLAPSLLLDPVDRGIIRIIDIAFVTEDRDRPVSAVELGGDPGHVVR